MILLKIKTGKNTYGWVHGALYAFLVTLLIGTGSKAQIVTIKMRDSTLLVAKLYRYSDKYLVTSYGDFKLNAVNSVRFFGKDVQKADYYAPKLRLSGITVWIDDKRLDPLAPALSDRELDSLVAFINVNEVAHGSIGLGVGLDYGGLGAQSSFYINDHVDLFVAGGYVLVGLGLQGGLLFNLSPKKKVNPTFGVMYGYNAALKVQGASQFDKIYYGPSISAGIMIRSRNGALNRWRYEVILPYRSSEFDADVRYLKSLSTISFRNEPWPVLISAGYLFGFRKK